MRNAASAGHDGADRRAKGAVTLLLRPIETEVVLPQVEP